jgi:hypothetical protein
LQQALRERCGVASACIVATLQQASWQRCDAVLWQRCDAFRGSAAAQLRYSSQQRRKVTHYATMVSGSSVRSNSRRRKFLFFFFFFYSTISKREREQDKEKRGRLRNLFPDFVCWQAFSRLCLLASSFPTLFVGKLLPGNVNSLQRQE